jgi:hypothetical protein
VSKQASRRAHPAEAGAGSDANGLRAPRNRCALAPAAERTAGAERAAARRGDRDQRSARTTTTVLTRHIVSAVIIVSAHRASVE